MLAWTLSTGWPFDLPIQSTAFAREGERFEVGALLALLHRLGVGILGLRLEVGLGDVLRVDFVLDFRDERGRDLLAVESIEVDWREEL